MTCGSEREEKMRKEEKIKGFAKFVLWMLFLVALVAMVMSLVTLTSPKKARAECAATHVIAKGGTCPAFYFYATFSIV